MQIHLLSRIWCQNVLIHTVNINCKRVSIVDPVSIFSLQFQNLEVLKPMQSENLMAQVKSFGKSVFIILKTLQNQIKWMESWQKMTCEYVNTKRSCKRRNACMFGIPHDELTNKDRLTNSKELRFGHSKMKKVISQKQLWNEERKKN